MDYKKILQYCKGETLDKATLGLIKGATEYYTEIIELEGTTAHNGFKLAEEVLDILNAYEQLK
jgi:hypothetical protein